MSVPVADPERAKRFYAETGAMRGAVLEVGDLDAAKTALTGRGLAFEGDDLETPWGRFAAFSDPDGNRWSLHQPLAG